MFWEGDFAGLRCGFDGSRSRSGSYFPRMGILRTCALSQRLRGQVFDGPCSAPRYLVTRLLYVSNMARRRHPKKAVEEVLRYAEQHGWTVVPTASGHRWGYMRCPDHDMHNDKGAAERAEAFGIRTVPAIVVDGFLLACCKNKGPTLRELRAAGLGWPGQIRRESS